MDLIKKAISLGYEKHSGFTSAELDEQPIISIYKQIEYCLLQKWLREKHNLHISIIVGHDEDEIWYNYYIYKIELGYDYDSIEIDNKSSSNTHEQALEDGLREALKSINQ